MSLHLFIDPFPSSNRCLFVHISTSGTAAAAARRKSHLLTHSQVLFRSFVGVCLIEKIKIVCVNHTLHYKLIFYCSSFITSEFIYIFVWLNSIICVYSEKIV